jgi:hypothetical protein
VPGTTIQTITLAMIAVATDQNLGVASNTVKQTRGWQHRLKADEGWIYSTFSATLKWVVRKHGLGGMALSLTVKSEMTPCLFHRLFRYSPSR